MKSASSLYHSLVWRVILDVCSRGVFFLVNILIARSLGVNDYGVFAYAVSLAQIFYIFTDLGIHLQLIKELGENRERNESHWIGFYELKIILFVVSLVVFLIALPFSWRWPDMWIPVLVLFWMFSNSMLDFNQHICNGLQRMDLAKHVMLSQRICVFVGTVAAVILVPTLKGVVVGIAVGGVTGTLVSNFIFHRKVRAPRLTFLNVAEWRRIFMKALPVGIGSALGSWYLRIGFIVLGWVASEQVIGEYSAAFRIFEITYIVPAAVMSIGVPHLSEALVAGPAIFAKELKRILLIMLPVAVVWGGFLFLFRFQIILLLYGERFAPAIPILQIFSVVSVFVFLNYVVTHLMVIANTLRRHVLNLVVAFLVCGLLTVILTPQLGAGGAAWSLLVTEALLCIMTTGYLFQRYGTILTHE